MIKLKTKVGFIKIISEVSEMKAGTYFLLNRMLILRQSIDIKDCVDRAYFFMSEERTVEAMGELKNARHGLHIAKNDIDLSFALLSCLEATQPVFDMSEAIKKEKWLRTLEISPNDLLEMTEGLKKKLIAS